jgi:hypothetical protein
VVGGGGEESGSNANGSSISATAAEQIAVAE